MKALHLFVIVALLVPITSERVSAMGMGDRGRLTFPFRNSRLDAQPITASLQVVSKPSWMQLMPRSNYGPIAIPVNGTSPLMIEFKAGTGYSANQSDEIVVTLNFQPSDMFAQSLTCRISSEDSFASHIQDCSDQTGLRIAETLYPDHSPPQTRIHSSAPPYVGSSGVIYYSTQTRITLIYSDIEISSYTTSGIDAFTYSVDGASVTVPPGMGEVDLVFPEGLHILAYSAADSQHNIEPVNSTAAFF